MGKKKPILYFRVDFSFLFFFSFFGFEPAIYWNVEAGLNFSLFSCNNCLTEMKFRQFLDFVSFQFLTITVGVIDRCSIVVSKEACQKHNSANSDLLLATIFPAQIKRNYLG